MKRKEPFRTYPGCYEGTGWVITEPLSKRQVKKGDQEFYKNPVKYLKNPHPSTCFNTEKEKFNEYCKKLVDSTIDELQEIDRYCDGRLDNFKDIENGNFSNVSLVFSFAAIALSSFAMYITIMQGLPNVPNAAPVSGLTVALAFFIMAVCGVLYYCCESANKRVRKNKNKVLLFHSAVKDVLNEKLELST